MDFGVTAMLVDRQVLDHNLVGIEPHGLEAICPSLGLGKVEQHPPETSTFGFTAMLLSIIAPSSGIRTTKPSMTPFSSKTWTIPFEINAP
jgi:hypothetical protein